MKSKKFKAFTLVELIVVMVILAILAGLLVPSLVKYIDKAREAQVIAEARNVYTAAQTAISEQYGKNRKAFAKQASSVKYSNGQTRGFVSNNALARVQQNQLKQGNNVLNGIDAAIAGNILYYLDSDGSNPNKVYTFNSKTSPSSDSNSSNRNVTNYVNKNKQPGIAVCYKPDGKVDYVQFGNEGVLVTIQDGSIYVVKDGTFAYGASGGKNTYPDFEKLYGGG